MPRFTPSFSRVLDRAARCATATAAALVMVAALAPAPARAADRRPEVYDARLADWRSHQVVYQVFVDRFAADPAPETRKELYAPPRRLRAWTDLPTKGAFIESAKVWGHEVDFWGGTLKGVTGKLDHIQSLGANVVYLNPVFLALTNHKYDATDYFAIDPQYGTREDFSQLCAAAHRRGMRVVLDGVLNHVGERGVWFQEALKNPAGPRRNYFTFDTRVPNGYVSWIDVPSLPELNYDNPAVRDEVYGRPDSVVQSWLKDADGWRLDVAFELGPRLLAEVTAAAHRARPDSYVTGEIYNYPEGWIPALDGVMNMFLARIILELTRGELGPRKASDMIEMLIADLGIEGALRSWIVLSNHDRSRLKSVFPKLEDRRFALALQATLPGAPLVYYGEEIGLEGAEDPAQRGPMDWERVRRDQAPELALTRSMLKLRNAHRALAVGDYRRIPAERLLAFARVTAAVRDTVVVVANPGPESVTEVITPRDGMVMDDTELVDLFSSARAKLFAGMFTVTVPPKTVQAYQIVVKDGPGYSRYKRVP